MPNSSYHGPRRRGRAVPPAPSTHDASEALMTESMEALSDVAFLCLARLRRLIGDGGQVRMSELGFPGAAAALNCAPPRTQSLLEEMAAGDFIRWHTDEAGYICIEVLLPPELRQCK